MASSSSQAKNLRGGQEGTAARVRRERAPPERSASFHHGTAAAPEHRQMRRPKTQPELLVLRGGATAPSYSPRRVPAKVLVNVTVQRSLGPVQVVASTDWTVGELAAAALGRYVREGRRAPLPAAGDPSAFELHYSQFSLECLDPEEKLIDLGSRNFFLCLKPDLVSGTMESNSSSATAGSCSKQAEKATKISWLSFIDCLL
ncbi:uncharacterized protein At4g22758-like [Zingiber officinale]|uniref:DUF7054 domain-containing protein n=1 Tax=Zingiber officinale TaxID=94328 RepID=A0A8J5K9R5_ZINOF|nr:uncharacterized protein At4g22758-like [Zingiber officinale]KAG6479920.1 hypothetical protein ZIOFF_063396 [Zingiber officinale]